MLVTAVGAGSHIHPALAYRHCCPPQIYCIATVGTRLDLNSYLCCSRWMLSAANVTVMCLIPGTDGCETLNESSTGCDPPPPHPSTTCIRRYICTCGHGHPLRRNPCQSEWWDSELCDGAIKPSLQQQDRTKMHTVSSHLQPESIATPPANHLEALW